MPRYLVETISMFRNRYVVETNEESDALDEVTINLEIYNDEWKEFSQKHIAENISSSREISDDEYLELFDKDNGYLSDWPDEKKWQFVNIVDYSD
jgi:hypothetical protein